MTYANEILKKLENSDNWPGFERPHFLEELNELADSSYDSGTVQRIFVFCTNLSPIDGRIYKDINRMFDFLYSIMCFPTRVSKAKIKK